MNIPYSLPLIDQDVIQEVNDTLINTGWLTSGPKVKQLEEELKKLTGAPACICVNSWVSGAMLILRWFGVGPGDEVIIPSYTYSATALAIMNIGATPVMVDVKEDFTIDEHKIAATVTPSTKAIIPVDLGGWPCNYDEIFAVVNSEAVKARFQAKTERQQKMGRLLVLADAAHSIGAVYKGRPAALAADVAIFSFHSVKNITTGEGGGICLNFPALFNNAEEYQFLKYFALNGQTKSAFEKNQIGGWRYDIVDQGMKVNMPDICAAIGLSQIRRYQGALLPERRLIYDQYNRKFSDHGWALLPPYDNNEKTSSYHLYLLRIKDITEEQRDQIIQYVSERGVGVNVHYIPMPMLTLFRQRGYKISDYPVTYRMYANEISLPLYNGMTEEQVSFVVETIAAAYKNIIK
ncbi:dTDP-4-amino-4,6-dideoxygalactose transaminase [Chitinophaga eiseniae]|uniref:dTDP-4-amino-4,6-dideoxygalactose transaminase n=1 Tax=Chitinophaga eiseniae TaxID=634771 RepID=A0A1T4RWS2_9BACT|nr:DegT/DnrJ/EryC1/StrS family aminotransferase [Chitinophaga eiseniae]SKA20430.1 dTDP-4-amino-4,6-dideoxygalactose transaminase [Chitinophaga eiseniae]